MPSSGMAEPNLSELKASGAVQGMQVDADRDAHIRVTPIRHAQLDTWWERALAILVLSCFAYALAAFLYRNLWL